MEFRTVIVPGLRTADRLIANGNRRRGRA